MQMSLPAQNGMRQFLQGLIIATLLVLLLVKPCASGCHGAFRSGQGVGTCRCSTFSRGCWLYCYGGSSLEVVTWPSKVAMLLKGLHTYDGQLR